MKWDNSKGLEAARKQSSAGPKFIDNYGDILWDFIARRSAKGERFTNDEVIRFLQTELGYAWRTAEQYWRAFYVYCLAAPEDFSGPASKLTNVRPGRHNSNIWYLADNPER